MDKKACSLIMIQAQILGPHIVGQQFDEEIERQTATADESGLLHSRCLKITQTTRG